MAPFDQLLPPDEPVQLLTPDGRYQPSDAFPFPADHDLLRRMYRDLVVSRRVDREAINLQRQGELALHCSSCGQEAAQVGSVLATRPTDMIFPQGREVAAAVARGLDVAALTHVWRGTWHACHDPYEHGFWFYTIPIATQALHATGYAMGARLDGTDHAVLCYFGDGATSEGDVHEALNFAGVFGAPVVFLVQNNQWAISVPLAQQTRAPTLAHKGIGYGVPAVRIDGNDVLASYVVTWAAMEHARTGRGPVLIEAITYRMEAHTTSDDATRYRPPDELDTWSRRDPIVRLERYLRSLDLLDDRAIALVADEADEAAMDLRRAMIDAPAPDPSELFANVYVDPITRR